MADHRDSPCRRLAANPDFAELFRHPQVAARRAEMQRKLLGLGGTYRAGEVGEMRGFLAALDWIEKLPASLATTEQTAELHAEVASLANDREQASPRQLRAEALAAEG